MRLNYKTYPTDYIEELFRQGKRLKARCFFEYYHDFEAGEVNSFGFYAKSWGTKEKPMSKGTVFKWIQEFKEEIERFYNSWLLKNEQHYNSVRKKSERQVNDKVSDKSNDKPEKSGLEKSSKNESERQVNKDINLYDVDIETQKKFENLFFLYSQNTRYPGRKTTAFKEFLRIHKKIDEKELQKAIFLYLHDPARNGKKLNFANFLKEEAYLPYMQKNLRIKIDGEWKEGTYDPEEEIFIAKDGFKARLLHRRIAELFTEGRLQFVRKAA